METPTRNRTSPYHHGDLRAALVEAAVRTIEDVGPAAMSLREVARRAGVTHPAATYHFGDKAGLLTAVAAQGYRLLGDALRQAQERTADFLEVGVAYVRFAVTHRAHFEVMYRPELYDTADSALKEAEAAIRRSGPRDRLAGSANFGVLASVQLHDVGVLAAPFCGAGVLTAVR